MTTRKYAKDSDVSVRQSLAELEDLIERFAGGQPTGFASGRMGDRATVEFLVRGRRVRLTIRLPTPEEFADHRANRHTYHLTQEQRSREAWQREVNRLWRSLVAVVKAKLVAIDDGITTMEAEFLSNLVLPSGETVGERMAADLDETLRTGEVPPLMPGLPTSAKVIALGGGKP